MDLTDRISFSKSFDLAGQDKVLKDPGQLYIEKTINIGRFFDRFFRFWADCWSILGYSGDHLGMIRLGRVLGGFLACFSLEKSTYINFRVIFFFYRWVVCRKNRKVRCLVQVQK